MKDQQACGQAFSKGESDVTELELQSNLRTKDTLGTGILSSLPRFRYYYHVYNVEIAVDEFYA